MRPNGITKRKVQILFDSIELVNFINDNPMIDIEHVVSQEMKIIVIYFDAVPYHPFSTTGLPPK